MRRLRWTLSVLSILVTIAWPLSIRLCMWLSVGSVSFCFGGGAISIEPRLPDSYWFKMHTETWENGFFYMSEWNPRFEWTPHLRVVLPFAWLWPLSSIPALMLWYFHVATRRHARAYIGRCQECGYNLMGNTSRVCPECGKSTQAQAPALMPRSEARLGIVIGSVAAIVGILVALLGPVYLPPDRGKMMPLMGTSILISGILMGTLCRIYGRRRS